jgi:hypothetical protein
MSWYQSAAFKVTILLVAILVLAFVAQRLISPA